MQVSRPEIPNHGGQCARCTAGSLWPLYLDWLLSYLQAQRAKPGRQMMDRKKVNSSAIRSIGFDERNRILEVEFKDGRIIQYSGVSAEINRRLISAPSIVSYFRDNIEESFTAKRIR